MSSDFTEQQSAADQQRSQELSRQRTRPPTEVPGYQAQRFLGAGAYGEVWAGVDRNTGRKVAIKFYAHRRGVDWSLLSREVEKLVFLSADRYVVQLLQVGWDADPPFYVMELIENGSLDDLLQRHGTFGVAEGVEMFREIAIGLAHAHGKGVLHCDLKPANILLDQDQKPRLADFGQSRLSHEQKPALGTLFYMAPEQADLEAVPDVRWDVYALGAIFHTLLLGFPPHRNDDTVSKLDTAGDLADRLARYRHAIRSAPPPSEHRKLPGMDRALADILDRCLAANPDDRFSNVQELLDALAARDRNRALLPLLVLGFLGPLIVLLVTAFFSYRGYVRAVKEAEQGYGQLAVENNRYAAELAAEKVTGEIGRYFEIARLEAEQGKFRPLLFAVQNSPVLEKLVASRATPAQFDAERQAFSVDPERRALDRYLQSRIDEYTHQAAGDSHAPRFASIFVTDRHGTQLAAAFSGERAGQSIGKNLAHRCYFHGGVADGDPFAEPPTNPPHVAGTHLSAVFKSTTTKKWVVAVSTPLWREDPQADGRPEFVGVLALTINVGDFEFFRATESPDHRRFAVLVDGRGEGAGTILQHPLFDELLREERELPAVLVEREYRVPTEVLSGGGTQNYVDPLHAYPAKAELAQSYDRRWVAASAPVRKPVGASGDAGSGLEVLVQSDYQSVVQPSRQLGSHFIKNSFWMLVVTISVSLALWYVVVRTFRQPRVGLGRPATPVPESTPVHGMTTIAAPRRERD